MRGSDRTLTFPPLDFRVGGSRNCGYFIFCCSKLSLTISERAAIMQNKILSSLELLSFTGISALISALLLCGGDWSTLTNSSDILWLLDGDRAYGLVGWLDYLRFDWSLPLGTQSNYLYPLPSNIALTDSVPLLCIIAKLFAPKEFTIWHPFGYWLISCAILQAVFAALLANRLFARSTVLRCSFPILVSVAPPFFFRNMHLALMAHWILLAAFLIGVFEQERDRKTKTFVSWLLLTGIAALVHPYWPPMVLIIAATSYYTALRRCSSLGIRSSIGVLARLLGLLLVALAGFGAVGILGQPKPTDNLHIYTSDILMHFNSYAWSSYIPALFKFRSGQYEGFAYLGAGNIFLLCSLPLVTKALKLQNYSFKTLINPSYTTTGVGLGCIVLFVWSLGAKVRLLGQTMGYLDFLYEPLLPVLGTFRSVGRFAWGLHYFIIILIFFWLSNLWSSGRKTLASSLAILAVIFQLAEARDKSGSFFVRNTSVKLLDIPEWSDLLSLKSTIELVPPEISGTPCATLDYHDKKWMPLAILAVQRGMRFNSGGRANPPEKLAKDFCHSFDSTIAKASFDPQSVYVLGPWADPSWKAKLLASGKLKCTELSGGYEACLNITN